MAIHESVFTSSVEPSFRELDDVFLKSQAKIWLGEVLHTSFDEQQSICDLLSDGELLFEVSKALWNMLLNKYMELNNFKARMFIPVDTRKSSGRYRPYSNVDSFLKVCKVVGLSGVDLFSPSDVVEKRDTRKVCICIRALSKKAKSQHLNVPDFDNVTKTVPMPMPTDVVRCIRRSLELSTGSVTHGQIKDARLKFRQKSFFESHTQEDESSLEESDEEKRNFSDTSYADFLYLESGESPEEADKYALTRGIQQPNTTNQETDKFADIPGSAESLFLQHVRISSHASELRDEFISINHEEFDHHMSLSDMISFRILADVPFQLSECQSCMGSESHTSNTTPDTSISRIWRKFPDEMEASSTSTVRSVVGRVLDFDFDFDAKSEPDNQSDNDHCYAEDTTKAATASKDETEEDGIDTEKKQSYVVPLIKSVAKGTALISILFLLHRRNRKKLSQIHWMSSTRKAENGSKIYPVDKFKFED